MARTNPLSKGDFRRDDLPMKPIERDILLADSGELSTPRRALLWLRLRADPAARRYARIMWIMHAAQGGIGAPVIRRRTPLVWTIAPLSAAAAAAVALMAALWFRPATSAGPDDANGPVLAATGDILETPIIARARLLAIRAERPGAAPPTRDPAPTRVSMEASTDILSQWSNLKLDRSFRSPME